MLVRFLAFGTAVLAAVHLVGLGLDNHAITQLASYGLTTHATITALEDDGTRITYTYREIGGSLITSTHRNLTGKSYAVGERVPIRYDMGDPSRAILRDGLDERIQQFYRDILVLVGLIVLCVLVGIALGEVMSRGVWKIYSGQPREAFRGRATVGRDAAADDDDDIRPPASR
jgi:hypothetical protein